MMMVERIFDRLQTLRCRVPCPDFLSFVVVEDKCVISFQKAIIQPDISFQPSATQLLQVCTDSTKFMPQSLNQL